MSQNTSSRPQLKALTSLRFFAAACIVAHHMRGSFGLPVTCYQNLNLGSAVSLFFVLSGFVLAYAHDGLKGRNSILEFYTRRWFRIWPLHIVVLAGVILFGSYLNGGFSWIPPRLSELAANVFLVQAWVPVPAYYFSFNAVSWSISVEWFFYLLFPVFVYVMLVRRHVFLALFLSATLVLLMQWIAGHFPVFSGMTSGINQHGLVYISPVSRLFEFVVGMAVWIGVRSSAHLINPAVMNGLQILALLLGVLYILKSSALVGLCKGSLQLLVGSSSGVFVWAFLIWALSFPNTEIARVLGHRFLVFLGEVSFALYMVHYPLGRQIAVWVSETMGWAWPPTQVAVYFGIISLFACFLYFFIEKPSMACGRKIGRFFAQTNRPLPLPFGR
jgi:peptidoglycan/LPS O-acetylase OafA/YrhL